MRNCDVCGKITHGYFDVEVWYLCDSCMEEFLDRTSYYVDEWELLPVETNA